MDQIDRLALSMLLSGLAIGAIVGFLVGVWTETGELPVRDSRLPCWGYQPKWSGPGTPPQGGSGVPPRTSPDQIAKSYNDGKPIPPRNRLIKEGKRKPEIE